MHVSRSAFGLVINKKVPAAHLQPGVLSSPTARDRRERTGCLQVGFHPHINGSGQFCCCQALCCLRHKESRIQQHDVISPISLKCLP